MKGAGTIAAREFAGFFRSMRGYVTAAVFVVLVGVFLLAGLEAQHASPESYFFTAALLVQALIVTLVGAQTIAPERSRGSLELLMSRPVSVGAIVVGKFAGAVLFAWVMLLPTVVHQGALQVMGFFDWRCALCGYVMLVLSSGLFASVGVLASAVARTMAEASALAMSATVVLVAVGRIVPWPGPVEENMALGLRLGKWLAAGFRYAGVFARARRAVGGALGTSEIVYFATATAALLVLAVVFFRKRP